MAALAKDTFADKRVYISTGSSIKYQYILYNLITILSTTMDLPLVSLDKTIALAYHYGQLFRLQQEGAWASDMRSDWPAQEDTG
jgi:hypothetical protein